MYNPTAHIALKKLRTERESLRNDKISKDYHLRLTALFSDIYKRFVMLYGKHSQFEAALEILMDVMAKAASERPQYLQKVDASREARPDWFCSEEIAAMMMYVDRFNGNLLGILDKLDYLDELGINMLHLMPLFESPKNGSDGGYAVSNFKQVDPKFGTNQDLLKVLKTLKSAGKLVMLDFVVNHTSEEHEWAKQAKKGDKHYQDYYYTFPDRSTPDLYEQSLPEVFPESAPGNFTYNKEMNKWVMTVFNNYQWDLNYTNPFVFVEMLGNVLTQANMGVDIFRMDAVAFVWKEIGTSCQNLPEAHSIHQLIKLCTQVVAPGVAFLAEAIVAPEEIVKYFGESTVWSNEHDMAYNATLMALLWNSIATRSTRVMKAGLRDKPKKPNGTTWVNYVRCHDDIGMSFEDRHITESGFDPQAHRSFLTKFYTGDFHGSFAKGMPFMFNPKTGDARISGSLASLAGLEQALSEKNKLAVERAVGRINLLHGMILAFGGIPVIYSGDEIAMLNDYSFLEDEHKSDDNRWVHRPMMNWAKAEKRKSKKSPEFAVFTALQHMIHIRKESPEFADQHNFKLVETANEHVFAFERKLADQSTLVVGNFKDDDQEVFAYVLFAQSNINTFEMIDKITGKTIKIQHGRLYLKPYTLYWLTQKTSL